MATGISPFYRDVSHGEMQSPSVSSGLNKDQLREEIRLASREAKRTFSSSEAPELEFFSWFLFLHRKTPIRSFLELFRSLPLFFFPLVKKMFHPVGLLAQNRDLVNVCGGITNLDCRCTLGLFLWQFLPASKWKPLLLASDTVPENLTLPNDIELWTWCDSNAKCTLKCNGSVFTFRARIVFLTRMLVSVGVVKNLFTVSQVAAQTAL